MITFKLSPSQDNNWYFCERQWFITYGLGYKTPGGKAANLGTTMHKVMEILALAKLHHQNTGENKFTLTDKTIGKYDFDVSNWFEPGERKVGRSLYNVPGVNMIDELFSLVYAYYSNLFDDQEWDDEDKKNILRWIYTIIHEKNGLYDVRKNDIVKPEQYLSLQIQEDWAKFNYGDGVEGYLTLTGIIDLIKWVDRENGIVEVVDYKSGQRKDWSTGEEKTADNLPYDTQLMFYYYFLSKLYPEFKHVLITIFYVKAGGPFTVPFEPSDLPRIEEHIKKTFTQITTSSFPKMRDSTQRDFKCRTFCPYFKMQLDNTNLCQAVGNRIKLQGIEQVTEDLKQK